MELSMPFIGWLATGGDASAYQYLLKGIQQFPSAEELASEITHIGFEEVSFQRLSLGIVAVHLARKAGPGVRDVSRTGQAQSTPS
jgi:ubiquinone/menaquinone biosynthesis C-methylase UbiE